MLVFSAIPHHHHNDGLQCFKTDLVNHACDDQHAQHHNPTTENSTESSSCILHANFVIQQLDTNIRIKSFSLNYDDENEFNSLCALSVLEHINMLLSEKRLDTCETSSYLKSAFKTSPLGLRAPPVAHV